jgi:penicillin G amidase
MAAKPGTRSAAVRRTGCLGWLIGAVFWLLVFTVMMASLAAGAATIFVQRTLPRTSGTLVAPGLDATVTVIRDRWGVPHITATTEHDLAFAQGFVTAQDRLFQMEVNRRVAEGRLAEIFGRGPSDSVLDLDRLTRTLDLYAAAQAELGATDGAFRATLSAYADGVNAFVRTHGDKLPLEFTVLGFAPEPWRPVDTLAFGRVEALTLDSTWQVKYSRALLLGHDLSAATVSALFPAYPQASPTLLTARGTAAPLEPKQLGLNGASLGLVTDGGVSPAVRQAFARLSPDPPQRDALARTLLGGIADALGSNDWVVDGTRTASGKPLLANDPHLGISEPATWYQVALRGPRVDVVGFSFPGTPGVIIGHNRDIAWGVTNVGADNADLYMETLDPIGHPGQYEYLGAWQPLTIRQETVRVRGETRPITITVRATQHGPLLNDAVSDLAAYTTPVALKWTALQPGYQFSGFYALDQATGWASFQAALQHISISQNFVYADTAGNIGYQMSGLLPLRSSANDALPVPGNVADYEWRGYVPFSQMPSLFDPPTHVIATANNRIVPDTYPAYVASSWDAGFRSRRIVDQLAGAGGLTRADYAALQNDVYSIPAATLVPIYAAAGAAAGGDGALAAKMLGAWDDRMTRESGAAALYEVTTGMLARDLFEPVAGKRLYGIYRDILESSNMQLAVMDLLATPRAPFFGATTDAEAMAKRDAAVARALKEAMAALRESLGSDLSGWHWGALHQAHFAHPLASVSPLNLVFGIAPVQRPGDSATVDVGGSGGFSADPADYGQRTIPSMRQIIDLGNFDNSLWVIPAGESGQPYSLHYADLLPLWDQGRYEAMAYSADFTARLATDVLTLTPA